MPPRSPRRRGLAGKNAPSARASAGERGDLPRADAATLVPGVQAPGSVRLLIADDDAPMRALLRDMLRGLHIEIDEAANGWELLDRLANQGPHLAVITDLRMPAPSGLQVITMARVAGLETPFLLITAFPDASVRAAVDKLAAVSLLAKPFDRHELLAAIRAGIDDATRR
jgi:CheY-like chemotaxis protein